MDISFRKSFVIRFVLQQKISGFFTDISVFRNIWIRELEVYDIKQCEAEDGSAIAAARSKRRKLSTLAIYFVGVVQPDLKTPLRSMSEKSGTCSLRIQTRFCTEDRRISNMSTQTV